MTTRREGVVVRALGPMPTPDPSELRERLEAEGLAHIGIRLQLVPEDHILLEGTGG